MIKENTYKLFELLKENAVEETDPRKIDPDKVERQLHADYRKMIRDRIITENKKNVQNDVVGILMKETQKSRFLKRQRAYADKLKTIKNKHKKRIAELKQLGLTPTDQEKQEQMAELVNARPKNGDDETVAVDAMKELEAFVQKEKDDEEALRKKKEIKFSDDEAEEEAKPPSESSEEDLEAFYKKDISLDFLEESDQRVIADLSPDERKKVKPEGDYHITRKLFTQFLLIEGINRDFLDLIAFAFESYSEVVRQRSDNGVVKKINIRTFLFNFKKWLKDTSTMKDLVSLKKATDYNNILRNYIKDYESMYPGFRLEKMTHDNEKIKESLMSTRVSEEQFFMMRRRDFEIFDLKELRSEHVVVQEFLKRFDRHPYRLKKQQDKYDLLCSELPNCLEKKKRICNFLLENLTHRNFIFKKLVDSLDQSVQERAEFLEKLGDLVQNYKKEKLVFKEKEFTLFDLANHVYNQITDQEQNDLMFYLITKFKLYKNREMNRPDETPLDPKEPWKMQELDDTFGTICDKTQYRIKIVGDFLERMEDFLHKNGHRSHNYKVERAVHENLVTRFILKELEENDKKIEESAMVTMQLFNIYFENNLNYSFSLEREIYDEVNHVLKVKPSDKELKKAILALSMNPRGVAEQAKSYLDKKRTVRFMQPLVEMAKTGKSNFLPDSLVRNPVTGSDAEFAQFLAGGKPIVGNSIIKGSVNNYVGHPSAVINLEKTVPTQDPMGTKYPTILPTEYYKSLIDKQRVQDEEEKWYLRPHHIESLTDHPYSLKDNVMDSNYYTFYEELEKNPLTGEYINPEISKERKKETPTETMINALEDQISALKSQLNTAKRGTDSSRRRQPGINPMQLQQFYQMKEEIPKNSDAMAIAYESVLDDLRKKEKNILLQKRHDERDQFGMPRPDWYETKGTDFVKEMKKYDRVNNMNASEKKYISKLDNPEMY